MKDRKKVLNDLITNFGLEKASTMTGLSKLDLIRRSECYIDLSMANDILGDLINEGLFPMKYKNCQISIDRFSGTIDWYCDWSEDNWRDYREETTYTLATPFWDVNDGIPVDTNSYDGVDFFDSIIHFNEDDFDRSEPYTFIKWKDGFDNLALYDRWIRRFYLPQVYNAISEHLDLYRNLTY
jgi:hypothetical protein